MMGVKAISDRNHQRLRSYHQLTLIYRHSFAAQRSQMFFETFLRGRLIFLMGTSTAGKSSLSRALVKHNPRINSFCRTEFIEKYIQVALEHEAPEAYRYWVSKSGYANTLKAIDGEHLLLSNDSSSPERIALDALKKSMLSVRANVSALLKADVFTDQLYQAVIPLLQRKETVLIDSRNHHLILFYLAVNRCHCDTLKMLVYCPFPTLLKRVFHRNERALQSGLFFNARPRLEPLREFAQLFQSASQESEAIAQFDSRLAQEQLTKVSALQALSNTLLTLTGEQPLPLGYAAQLVRLTIQAFLAYPSAWIKPAISYNDVVYTNREKPKVLARQMIDKFHLADGQNEVVTQAEVRKIKARKNYLITQGALNSLRYSL